MKSAGSMREHIIDSVETLRELFPPPGERAVKKQMQSLDGHCRRFIELSPFVVVATGDGESFDASPRGGAPGFVRIVDESTVVIPDSPGNNRIDSLANIIRTGAVGLLFMIPGVDETLRLNGPARVSRDPRLLETLHDGKRLPRVAIEVTVREVFLHCAKALMRSKLWSEDSQRDRSVLPTMGEMLAEQIGTSERPETQEEMLARYRESL